jgi:hypothetical protein
VLQRVAVVEILAHLLARAPALQQRLRRRVARCHGPRVRDEGVVVDQARDGRVDGLVDHLARALVQLHGILHARGQHPGR